MEKQNQLATVQRMTPNFVQNALESIESVMKYADILLKSKLVPNHFYEKGADGKPDFTKGKPEAIVMVVQHGSELGLSVSQSLQQVVPVNGLMSVKGDGAKSLILTSGLCDIWQETSTGSIEEGNFSYEIYSKRKDGKEKRGKFSLAEAIRADLFYTDAQLSKMQSAGDWQQKKSNAFKYSAWYKYPTRMVMYRCIGFISRDLYPDVLQGMVTTEEAMDYKEEGIITIGEPEGKKMTMKEGAFEAMNEKSVRIAKNVNEAIDKANGGKHDFQEAEVVSEQVDPGKEVLTDEYLETMKDGVYAFASTYLPPAKYKVIEAFPRKKSQKQYREAILAHQDGKLDNWITEQLKGIKASETSPVADTPHPEKEGLKIEETVQEIKSDGKNISTAEATASFMAQKKEQPAQEGLFGPPTQEETSVFEIKEIDATGKRHFPNALSLSGKLKEIGVSDMEVQKLGFRNIDDFATKAKKEDIEVLMQKNM